jgi:hypothetical protein
LGQIAILLAVVAGIIVVVDFAQRLTAAQRLVDAANVAATEVQQLRQEKVVLQTQVAYATTDASVVAWAHGEGKLIQPNEVLVVPVIPTAQPTPVPVQPTPTRPPNWQLWYQLFFENQPRVP